MCRSGTKFDGSSTLVCPACNETVRVGFGGEKNLAIHRTSKACQKKSQKEFQRLSKMCSKPNQNLHAFFKPRAPLNPPTVTAPPPIHANLDSDDNAQDSADEVLGERSPETLGETWYKATSPSEDPCDNLGSGIEGTEIMEIHKETGAPLGAPLGAPPQPLLPSGRHACSRGIELLNRLEATTLRIPADVPLATPAHRLSTFSADPHTCVTSPDEDGWEDDWAILNAMLKASFGWGKQRCRKP